MLEVANIRKRYGDVVALDGVDLSVTAGEIVGLLGANGAGKTTLVSIVAGLRRPDAGSVRVAGVDALADPTAARRHIGLAPQDLGFYPGLTVRANLRFFAELARVPAKVIDDRVEETAAALGLASLLKRRAARMSGGEKRRLHTALALIHRPPLVLLDEPTAGADVGSRAQLLELVRELAAEGTAICYTTHYLTEIEELAARVAILNRGRIVLAGAVADLLERHGEQTVRFRFDGGSVPSVWKAPTLSTSTQRPVAVSRDADMCTITIDTDNPPLVLREAFQSLSDNAAQRLRSIEIFRPTLDSVYLAATGEQLPSRNGETDQIE